VAREIDSRRRADMNRDENVFFFCVRVLIRYLSAFVRVCVYVHVRTYVFTHRLTCGQQGQQSATHRREQRRAWRCIPLVSASPPSTSPDRMVPGPCQSIPPGCEKKTPGCTENLVLTNPICIYQCIYIKICVYIYIYIYPAFPPSMYHGHRAPGPCQSIPPGCEKNAPDELKTEVWG